MASSIWSIFVVIVCLTTRCVENRFVGGIGDEKPVDANIHEVVSHVDLRSSIGSGQNALLTGNEINIEPVSYRTQVVNGVNYFVKLRAQVGNNIRPQYYVAKIYKSFDGNIYSLVDIQPVGRKDEINYF